VARAGDAAPVPPGPPPTAPAAADRRAVEAQAAMARSVADYDEPAPSGGGGVMAVAALIGFSLLAAVLAYVRQDAIAAAAPQLAEPLAAYVAWVDRMREAMGVASGGS
jgi:hypothetical protein